MFGRKAHAASVEFLQRQLKVLDAALQPRPEVDYNAEMTAVCLAKRTSLTVSFTNEEPQQ